ncbi:MAG: DUF1636 family protein [Pseudomonadota bacterium]
MIRKPGDLPSIIFFQQSGGCPGKELRLTNIDADPCTPDVTSDGERIEDTAPATPVTIVVCESCRFQDEPHAEPRPGALLAQATAARAGRTDHLSVRQVACLANCKRGLSAALIRDGAWSYVFGDLDIDDASDLVTAAEMFHGSVDGVLPYRNRPEALKGGLVARIPPVNVLKEVS